MSAWIVSRAHIDLLVQALCESEIVPQPPDEVGCELWAENLASITYRYPSATNGNRPGPNDFKASDVKRYTYTPPTIRLRDNHAMVHVACRCYHYQSCEHPGWEDSNANRWITELFNGLNQNPANWDRESQPWGIQEQHVRPTTVTVPPTLPSIQHPC